MRVTIGIEEEEQADLGQLLDMRKASTSQHRSSRDVGRTLLDLVDDLLCILLSDVVDDDSGSELGVVERVAARRCSMGQPEDGERDDSEKEGTHTLPMPAPAPVTMTTWSLKSTMLRVVCCQ